MFRKSASVPSLYFPIDFAQCCAEDYGHSSGLQKVNQRLGWHAKSCFQTNPGAVSRNYCYQGNSQSLEEGAPNAGCLISYRGFYVTANILGKLSVLALSAKLLIFTEFCCDGVGCGVPDERRRSQQEEERSFEKMHLIQPNMELRYGELFRHTA